MVKVKTRFDAAAILISCFILLLMLALLINPAEYMASVSKGLNVWALSVVPSLLPFLFFTHMLTDLRVIDKIARKTEKFTKKLFNCPGVSSYVYIMSIFSGDPIGAKVLSELYEKNLVTKNQCARIATFTSTSGPLFVIGTVGASLLLSPFAGVIILIAHLLASLLNGILYRGYKRKKDTPEINEKFVKTPPADIGKAMSDGIYDSVLSILIIGGYIALFFMAIDVLHDFYILQPFESFFNWLFNLLGLPGGLGGGLASGIIEKTRGCFEIAGSGASLAVKTVLCCGIISWGSLSIQMQSLTFLKKCDVKFGFYFLQKLTHSLMAVAICIPLVLLLM